MKKCVLFIIFKIFWLPLIAQEVSSQKSPINLSGQILFLGNSITYDGQYVAMVESLLLNRELAQSADIINLGLPSETVSGLSEDNHANGEFPRPWLFDRLSSILEKTKPKVVFVCYGMNDGIYLPFDDQRFKAYQEGVGKLYKQLRLAGVKRIILLTPPVHDDKKLGLAGYNLVLDRYAEWLLAQRKDRGWEVIDLHFPMKQYLELHRQKDPLFKLADDGIHPGKEGHWLMARSILAHLDPTFPRDISWEECIAKDVNLEKLYVHVRKRQDLMKLAWLTYTGHKRPGIPSGLPMKEANHQNKLLKEQISVLIH